MQWYLNGEKIQGANERTYYQTAAGLFSVSIEDSNGCSSISDEYDLAVSVNELIKGNSVSVYPNPGDGEFTLFLGNHLNGDINLRITNIIGETVFKGYYNLRKSDNDFIKFRLNNQPAGMYFINIESRDKKVKLKLIKK